MTVRILIADDHAVFRAGLRGLIEKEKDLSVVGEAGTFDETLRLLKEHETDVLLLDLTMPGGQSAAAVAREAITAHPDLAIVVLTMHEDTYYLRQMFEAGACGYLLKKSSADDLVAAVRAAHRGDHYVDPALGGAALSSLMTPQKRKSTSGADVLTAREKEVCRLLALGHTNAETAKTLSISERTVETHRANLMNKLGLQSRAELVRFAIDNELLDLD